MKIIKTGGLRLKKVKVFELGGTISAQGNNRLDYKDYTSGAYDGNTFMDDIPELRNIADVTFETFLRISSTAIQPKHWLQLRKKIIHALEKENMDGIVVTHGTNTLEETAYFLHLTLPTTKPVIITGAQRPYTAFSTDGPNNLIQSIRAAASEAAYHKGVLVLLNDEINSAREATKTNTYRLETFQSGQLGFLGYVDVDGETVFYQTPHKKHTAQSIFSAIKIDHLPSVEIIYSYAGATGDYIEYIAKSKKVQGIVAAGTGAGLVSPSEQRTLEAAAAAGITIVRSSRVENGRVLPVELYEKTSFITADNLNPQKARILLMLSLVWTTNCTEIQRYFQEL